MNTKWGGGIAAVLSGTASASAFDIRPHVFLARDLETLARRLEVGA